MKTTKANKAEAKTKKKITELDPKQLKKFCDDLVNAPEYARRLKTASTTIYTAIADGLIKEADIFWICGKRHWSWKKYKHLSFRSYHKH